MSLFGIAPLVHLVMTVEAAFTLIVSESAFCHAVAVRVDASVVSYIQLVVLCQVRAWRVAGERVVRFARVARNCLRRVHESCSCYVFLRCICCWQSRKVRDLSDQGFDRALSHVCLYCQLVSRLGPVRF